MTRRALAYVFIYGVTAGALVLALTPVSYLPAGGGTEVGATAAAVPAVLVSVDGSDQALAGSAAQRCPYLAVTAPAGHCPYLAAMAAAGCPLADAPGLASAGGSRLTCPYLEQNRAAGETAPDGAVTAVLRGLTEQQVAGGLPL